ncbi:MAG: ABC transporter permease [Acidobacteria bacterium]|nr:ABC transporter permease [Acidobacteriota bacterium]
MNTYLQIAWKNLIRSGRRTVVTLIAIVVGIAMMVFTNGFNAGMTSQWGSSLINETDGHVKIHHVDFYKFGISDREKVFIENPDGLIAELRKSSHVTAVMSRTALAGLIGRDENSTTFYGAVNDLAEIDAVLPDHGKLVVEGRPLSGEDPNGVLIGRGLARSLAAGIGDELVILSSTIQGDQSSTLVHVRGLIRVKDNPQAEQSVLLGGLSDEMRIDLLDSGAGTTELVVRLDAEQNVKQVVDSLNRSFASQGAPWIAEPWYSNRELSFLTAIFNGIGVTVTIVLSLIVSFIVSNAMLMSIFERIREVGSIRAIGADKRQIYGLFYLEYLIMTSLGGLLGLVAGALLITLGQHTGISFSDGIFAGVRPVLEIRNLLTSFLIPLAVAAGAVFFPVRSSCRMSVVDSLNYN